MNHYDVREELCEYTLYGLIDSFLCLAKSNTVCMSHWVFLSR